MYYFGKKTTKGKKTKTSQLLLPSPDVAGTTEFGRYLQYGRRSLFGRRYFGFGKGTRRSKKVVLEEEPDMGFGRRYFGFGKGSGRSKKVVLEEEPDMGFGRRRRRKGVKKGGKPPKALIKMCKRYRIKVTRKVGKKKVYKSIAILKRQLKLKQRKSKKSVKKTRRSRRKTSRKKRRSHFSLFGFKF